jgi:hypothetical protein
LLKNDDKCIKSCMTKCQLKSFLGNVDVETPIPKEGALRCRELIKSWEIEERCQYVSSGYRVPGRTRIYRRPRYHYYMYTKKKSLFVDVELREGPCNLVERSIFVYIRISESFGQERYPEWWDYNVWVHSTTTSTT